MLARPLLRAGIATPVNNVVKDEYGVFPRKS